MAANLLTAILSAIYIGKLTAAATSGDQGGYLCPTSCYFGCEILLENGEIRCAQPSSFCANPTNYMAETEVKF
jgi:hypothetical protein